MKSLLTAFISVFVFSSARAASAASLDCKSSGGDFEMDAVISLASGDLMQNSLTITAAKIQKTATAKQYMNYDDHLFVIASLGPQKGTTDAGYVIDVEKESEDSDPNAPVSYSGSAQKYSEDQPGHRVVDSNSQMDISCTATPP